MIIKMIQCEAARPAIQKGKPVLDAAREYFSKDSGLCMYINTIYWELQKKDGEKKHRRKGAAQGQERDNKGEKKKHRRKGAMHSR